MVKKSIIAIALIGMLATVSYAQDTQVPGQLKIDGCWPCTYTPIVICRIPIYLKVGMFFEIKDCSSKKIVMEQVTCPSGQSFPCYKGCVTIKVRANFEAQLSLKLTPIGSIISSTWGVYNWKAYFRANSSDTTNPPPTTWLIAGLGNEESVDICVETWDANIYAGDPELDYPYNQVGEVAVSAVPTAAPECD